jgi:hypothetical protein
MKSAISEIKDGLLDPSGSATKKTLYLEVMRALLSNLKSPEFLELFSKSKVYSILLNGCVKSKCYTDR